MSKQRLFLLAEDAYFESDATELRENAPSAFFLNVIKAINGESPNVPSLISLGKEIQWR